jgi:hypothetical protein
MNSERELFTAYLDSGGGTEWNSNGWEVPGHPASGPRMKKLGVSRDRASLQFLRGQVVPVVLCFVRRLVVKAAKITTA